MTNELATIEPLTQALALATEAGDIDKLRDVSAWATALRNGARARGMGIEAENKAAEVILRAERAMGVVFERMFADGTMKYGGRTEKTAGTLPTYADFGITRPGDGQHFRLLARMTDARFEELIEEHRAKGERIAKVNFYRDDAEAARKRAAKDLREVLSEDEAPLSVVENFRAAAEAMIAAMSQTPGEELATVAGLIKALYDEYVQVMRGA